MPQNIPALKSQIIVMVDCMGVFRVVTFLLHFISAIFLAVVAVKCGGTFSSNIYMESFSDSVGYQVISPEASCSPSESKTSCFFSVVQSYDVNQDGLKLNVLALLAAFEWISASFALFYLVDVSHAVFFWTPMVSNLWNALGVLIFMPYTMPLGVFQTGITALSLLASTMALINETFQRETKKDGGDQEQTSEFIHRVKMYQSVSMVDSRGYRVVGQSPFQPVKKLTPTQTILHYTEYCTSASLLFVAVSILYMPDPLSWTIAISFVSILLCNLTGIGAHFSKLDQHNTTSTHWYDLDWSKPGNHFKLFMIHSWSCLCLALCILIYNSWSSLSSTDVPLFVRFTLYNLLVTYSLFGIAATICYAMAGNRNKNFDNFDKWLVRLDYALTIGW